MTTDDANNSADEQAGPEPFYRIAVAVSPNDRDAALAILCDVLGLNAIDARTRLRHVPADWPEKQSREVAVAAASQLRELGAEAAAVNATDVPDLRFASTLHHIRCETDGLVNVSIAGDAKPAIPWAHFLLLSVADVADFADDLIGSLPDGVFRHAPGIGRFERAVEQHGLEMWLIAENPFQAFRVVAELMNYEYLAERRSTSSEANFRMLVKDIHHKAHSVTLTESARSFINRMAVSHGSLSSSAAHRDLVTAYWAILESRPSDPTVQLQSPVSESSLTDRFSPLQKRSSLPEIHRLLQNEIESLRSHCREHLAKGSPETATLVDELRELGTTLNEHFALEEDGGYLQEVIALDPRYTTLVEGLLWQHRTLQDQLERLCAKPDDLVAGIGDLLNALTAHQHAENSLAQSAFDDVATGD